MDYDAKSQQEKINRDRLLDEEDDSYLKRGFSEKGNAYVSERKQLCLKFSIFLFCLSVLIFGRFTVPDNEPPSVVDIVQNWLINVNYYILHNTGWRDALQITCSAFMDILFLTTSGYWVLYSKSSRLIVTILLFYGVRNVVQQMWWSPFPAGFWWYDPGFPSLIVPYGRGSDFFFSGHVGFVVICGTEWKRVGNLWMAIFSLIGGIYTTFILLSYQVHYCIDIFTGVVFAHWCYVMVDQYKESIDGFCIAVYLFFRRLFRRERAKSAESSHLIY